MHPIVAKTATKTPSKSRSSASTATRKGSSTGNSATASKTKTLSAYIEERFEEFSRSQKDVARYIVDHLDEAAFQTAEELARRANTSSSTVVRFSQALGFEGYPELQQAAIEEYRHSIPKATDGGGALFDFDQNDFESSLAADHANIEETAKKLSAEKVEETVRMMSESKRVVIVGMEQMAFFASYMRHLLALLDIRTEVIAAPRRESINRLGNVDEDTLVLAFSAGRAHPFLIRAMKLARHRQAKTVAITDATLSEVGEHVDETLYYSSNSPSYSRSNAALLAVVQALAHAVYARDEESHKDRIRAYKLK